MGILEELGLTEDDLNPFKQPPSVLGEPIPQEVLDTADEEIARGLADEVRLHRESQALEQEDGDLFNKLRNTPIDLPAEKLTKPKPKSKSKRVVYSVRCTLNLCGSDYSVELLPSRSEYQKAYRLTKINAPKPTGYSVIQVDGEVICECPDFKHRYESAVGSRMCKHIRGLTDLGFFTAQSPADRVRPRTFDS